MSLLSIRNNMKKFFSRRQKNRNTNIEEDSIVVRDSNSQEALLADDKLQSTNEPRPSTNMLPIEIWQRIFRHLTSEEDLLECIKVSEQWFLYIRDMLMPDTFAQQVIHPLAQQHLRRARLSQDYLKLCLTFIDSSEEPFHNLEELEIEGLTSKLFIFSLEKILRNKADSLKRIVLVNPIMSLQILTTITTMILQCCPQLLELAVISVDKKKQFQKRQWPLTPKINIIRQYPREPRYLAPCPYLRLASLRICYVVDNIVAGHVLEILQNSRNLTHVILNPLTTTAGHADIFRYCVNYLGCLHVLIMADGGRADMVLRSNDHCGNPPGETTDGVGTAAGPSTSSSSSLSPGWLSSPHNFRRTFFSRQMEPQHMILLEEGRRVTGDPHWSPRNVGVTHLQSSFRKIFLESLYPAKNIVWPQLFDYNVRHTSFHDLRYFAVHLGRGTTSKLTFDIDRIIYIIMDSSSMLESFTYRRDHLLLSKPSSSRSPRITVDEDIAHKTDGNKKEKKAQEKEFQDKGKKPDYKKEEDDVDYDKKEWHRHNVSDRLLEILMQNCYRLTTFRVVGSYHFSDKRLREFIWFYSEQLTKLELDCSIGIDCLSFILENATGLEKFCLRHRCAFKHVENCLTMGQGRALEMLTVWGGDFEVRRITPLENSWYDIS